MHFSTVSGPSSNSGQLYATSNGSQSSQESDLERRISVIADFFKWIETSETTPITLDSSPASSEPLIFGLPYSHPSFVGRVREREHLSQYFEQCQIVAVTGLGGIGKTDFAVQYAWDCKAQFEVIAFIRVWSPKELSKEVADLARKLRKDANASLSFEEKLTIIREELEGRGGRALFIFDEMDDPAMLHELWRLLPYLGNSKILLTTRFSTLKAPQDQSLQLLSLGALSEKEAADYLLDAIRGDPYENDELSAAAVARELGCLPLALYQAARFIPYNSGYNLDNFLDDLRSAGLEMFSYENSPIPMTGKPVYKIWKKSLAAIEALENGWESIKLLQFMSIFKSAPMLPWLVEKWFNRSGNSCSYEAALSNLQLYSLLEISSAGYYCHPLLLQVVREGASRQETEYLIKREQHYSQEAIKILCEELKSSSQENVFWGEDLILHIINFTKLCHVPDILLEKSYGYAWKVGNYKLAEVLIGKLLGNDTFWPESDFGDALEARRLLYKAAVYSRFANWSSGLDAYKRSYKTFKALALREDGGNYLPSLAVACRGLGLCYQKKGKAYLEKKYYSKAQKISSKLEPEKRMTDLGICPDGWAIYLINRGKFEEALCYQTQLVSLCEAKLGDDPVTAECLSDLGVIHEKLEAFEKALDYHRRALSIREKVLDPMHPDIGKSHYRLGACHFLLKEYQQAFDAYARALQIQEKKLVRSHPDLLATKDGIRRVSKELHLPEAEQGDPKIIGLVSIKSIRNRKRFVAESKLQELHRACQEKRNAAIVGPRQSGKSSLAAQYVLEHRADYKYIQWICASIPGQIELGLMKLWEELIIPEGDVEKYWKTLHPALVERGEGILLIFDGVDTIERLNGFKRRMPDFGKATVILVSRLTDQLPPSYVQIYPF